MIIRCCEDCAEKFGRIYIVSRAETPLSGAARQLSPEGRAKVCERDEGECPFCFRSGWIRRYEMTKPAVRYRRQSGGGERMRSGGRR